MVVSYLILHLISESTYSIKRGIPALVDHDNNDFTIWESGAMVQYIVDRYDKDRKISYEPGTDEYYTQLQWIAFQISGQVLTNLDSLPSLLTY